MQSFLISLHFSPGGDIPGAYIEKATSVVPVSKLLVILIGIGSFVGSLIGCCMPRKKMSLIVSLVHIAFYGVVMGSLTVAVEAFSVLAYVITYCLLFGLFSGKQEHMLVWLFFVGFICSIFSRKPTYGKKEENDT